MESSRKTPQKATSTSSTKRTASQPSSQAKGQKQNSPTATHTPLKPTVKGSKQKGIQDSQPVSLSQPPSTWASLEHKETSLAAYLGFAHSKELRKALVQFPTLSAWKYFQGPAKNLSKMPVFALLDNENERTRIADTENPVEAWPVPGDNGNERIVPDQRKEVSQENRQNRTAWAILKLLALWKEWEVLSAADKEQSNGSVMRQFAATFDLEVPVKVPVNGPAPVFGPLSDHRETVLETYNRAWEMMRYLSSLMPKARNEEGKSLYHQRLVHGLEGGKPVTSSACIPWMNTQAKEAATSTTSSCEGSPQNHDPAIAEEEANILLPNVDIHVTWSEYRRLDGSASLGCVLEDAKRHGIAIPRKDQLLDRDPVGFESGESFRDYLRHLLNCGNIRMFITSFKLTYFSGDTETKRGMDLRRAPWRDIKKVFGDSTTNFDFVITLEVEAIDEEDDEAPLFEADAISPRVRQIVQE